MVAINEEDDDESGRTGPAGTIGGDAAQDCVSENIESNTRRMQKAINQSAKGNMQVNSRIPEEEKFDRESSDCSNVGVVREKVPLTNNNQYYRNFSAVYDELFM